MSKPRLSRSECLRVADEAALVEYRARLKNSPTPKPRAGEHTKGPWTMYANSPGDDALPSVMANNPQGGLFYVAQCNNKDDARRIVACVNACEGMLTENLEGTSMDQIYRQLREERDSLRERERELVDMLRDLINAGNSTRVMHRERARALLAKYGR